MLGSKFVPVTVTLVVAAPIVGVNPVTVGAPGVPTTNDVLLVAVPEGEVTLIGPVVAPTGTLVTIWFAVADVTVAATPLKVTVFCAGVELKAVPKIVTSVAMGPLFGVNSIMETWEEFPRVVLNKLPTAS